MNIPPDFHKIRYGAWDRRKPQGFQPDQFEQVGSSDLHSSYSDHHISSAFRGVRVTWLPGLVSRVVGLHRSA
jgi:hypothetical protein